MTCSDVQRVLPELLDGASDGAFQTAFETHVKSCSACSDLVSDLKLISSEARDLAASEEPAPQVWVRIAAQLRAEGLIVDQEIQKPESAPARPILVPTFPRRRWSALWLAPVAAALLAAGAYVISHKPAPQVAKQQVPAATVASPTKIAVVEPPASTSVRVAGTAPQQMAQKSVPPTNRVRSKAEPETSTEDQQLEDQQFLSLVSTRTPSMRATYENQLQAVNADIREVQNYLDRNPTDVDARQQLMDAYQQKALLYQIALDRIQ